MTTESFAVERIEGGLRFTASDGWVDLTVDGEGRGYVIAGTHNGTLPEIFGSRLWHLLHETMPELGLKVVSAECEPSEFREALYVGAGFQRDGVRRGQGEEFTDLVVYSILESEVRFEAKEQEVDHGEPISAE